MTNKNLSERMGVVETKVENLNEKLDDLKDHVCSSKDELKTQLENMAKSAEQAHDVLTEKITELEKIKDKWFWVLTGAVAAISWAIGHWGLLVKMLGEG
jgi:predicted nuclease with TOPRIM domain